jgi:hypothetical protein
MAKKTKKGTPSIMDILRDKIAGKQVTEQWSNAVGKNDNLYEIDADQWKLINKKYQESGKKKFPVSLYHGATPDEAIESIVKVGDKYYSKLSPDLSPLSEKIFKGGLTAYDALQDASTGGPFIEDVKRTNKNLAINILKNIPQSTYEANKYKDYKDFINKNMPHLKYQKGGYLEPKYMPEYSVPENLSLDEIQGLNTPKGTNIPSGAIGAASSFGSMALDKLGAQRDQTSTANMAMDAGSGALSGLAAGSAFGPIGMGVGALAGGAMGLITANKEKEAAEDLERKKERIKNIKDFNKELSKKAPVSYNPVFEKGGKMDKEMLEKFEGPKHTEGGIDLNIAEVEGGETEFKMEDYVFSDDINYPGTNMTFADKSKKIEDKYPGNDRFAKKAKERELKNLMEEQEEIKVKDSEDNKMQEGGFLPGSENTFTDIMSLLPTATTAGLTVWDVFSDPAEPDLPRMEGQAYTPQLISKDPYLREVEETFGEQERAITRGARTPGQYMAGRIQSATEESKAKSDIMRKIDQMNREERARAEQMGFEQDRINLMQEAEEERLRLQSLGAKRDAIRRGISSLGTQAGQIARDIRSRKAQEEYRDKLFEYMFPMRDNTNPDLNNQPVNNINKRRYDRVVDDMNIDFPFDNEFIDFNNNQPIDDMFMYDQSINSNEIQI